MNILDIAGQFALEGKIASVKPLGDGFINDTYVVRTEGDAPDYILQRKNQYVFPDVPAMMDNICAVTSHIKKKVRDPMRETLTVVPTTGGASWFRDDEGEFWAVCVFIADTVTFERADTPELARQGGVGIGRFQTLLSDFDKPLNEVIKGFHNIRWRFEQWDESIRKDAAGRVGGLSEEISWIEDRRAEMMSFWEKVENGYIPRRVAHNDTKLSNILFEKSTGKVLCAIDLDTVMSSTSLCDVGDALRSYTNTAVEDEPDFSKVSMDIDIYRAWIEGYLSERRGTLAPSEVEYLAFSGRYITFEQVLRFLMDYIDGDLYYKIKYPDHNLVRARSQYALLKSMEEQYPEMCRIVEKV